MGPLFQKSFRRVLIGLAGRFSGQHCPVRPHLNRVEATLKGA
ncbi:hypothetical protein ATPR_0576 [Acetobacter tropicalis NBRC 101654]|uniref:Uncharacterized protein n=1 Tax=Acetobacter tropicalis NBRC 101654 TaxID=749388 RepID=F7VB27_9PROT|nr:hypothetical protein ATPR_0576 [Acetobacter tropicalis NBRC 101654]